MVWGDGGQRLEPYEATVTKLQIGGDQHPWGPRRSTTYVGKVGNLADSPGHAALEALEALAASEILWR